MIYMWICDHQRGYYISNLNPDEESDYEKVLSNSIFVPISDARRVVSIEMGVARNVLTNGGQRVHMLTM
jgi:hypothetical protein